MSDNRGTFSSPESFSATGCRIIALDSDGRPTREICRGKPIQDCRGDEYARQTAILCLIASAPTLAADRDQLRAALTQIARLGLEGEVCARVQYECHCIARDALFASGAS